MAHLYASFADASLAEKAAGALLDYGVKQEDISIVAHEAHAATRETMYGTQSGANPDAGYASAGTAGYGTATGVAAGLGNGLAETGDRVAGATTGAFGAEGAAAGYETAASARATSGEAQIYDNPTSTAVGSDLNPMDQGGPDSAASHANSPEATDNAAKHGISTTTPEDAGEGAVKGTGIGLGVGILASIAALAVPGVGIVLGAGALASALGMTALAAGAAAVAGRATGYLKDQGVPADAAERYHGAVTAGGAVLSVAIPSGDVDQATASAVLSKYGASDVNAY